MHQILLSRYFREELKQRIWGRPVPGRPHGVLLGYTATHIPMHLLVETHHLLLLPSSFRGGIQGYRGWWSWCPKTWEGNSNSPTNAHLTLNKASDCERLPFPHLKKEDSLSLSCTVVLRIITCSSVNSELRRRRNPPPPSQVLVLFLPRQQHGISSQQFWSSADTSPSPQPSGSGTR